MSRVALPGVFCMEGPWEDRLTDRSSVRPLLELLEHRRAVRYIHRTAGTVAEFESVMLKWSQKRYDRYGFGYLAFHGSPAAIHIGRDPYDFSQLAELLRGRLTGRILYFGGCETLDLAETEVRVLLKETNARAICGYTTAVDWIESAAFELNLLHSVTKYGRVDSGFRYPQKHHAGACERLGLRAVWNGSSIW